jgi:hypothetical protein
MKETFNAETLQFANSIRIKPDEVECFVSAWDEVMNKFKIPDNHQPQLFFILKSFYTTIDTDFETIYDLNNALEAINFFIRYREAADKIEVKYGSSNSKFDELMKLQIVAANQPISLDYPGITKATINLLYNFLKGNDIHLIYHLGPHPEIPSLDILNGIKGHLNHNYDYKYQPWLIYTLEQVKEYINTHLTQVLIRKVNLFIFEVFYLFNLLQYAGKVNNIDSSRFELSDTYPKLKFKPTVKLSDTEKSNFIKTVIINAIKAEKYQQSDS